MADLKISQFTDGGVVQNTDYLAAERGGDNAKVLVGTAASLDAGTGIGDLVVLEDNGSGQPALPAVDGSQLLNMNAQPYSDTLTALSGYDTNGFLVQTATDTFTGREITGTAKQVIVTDGDGVSGNPVLSLPQDIATDSSPTFAGMTIDSPSSTLVLYQSDQVAGARRFEVSNTGGGGSFFLRTRNDDGTGGTVAWTVNRTNSTSVTGQSWTVNSGDYTFNGGDIISATVGKTIRLKEGTGGMMGSATLAAGVATVTITGLTTTDRAFVQCTNSSGTLGVALKAVCTANTLTITSVQTSGTTQTLDTSSVSYIIFRPSP